MEATETNIPVKAEVNLYDYIASKRNPAKADKAIRYIMSQGYEKPASRAQLARMLHDFVVNSTNPDMALRNMVNAIHPDKELFVIEIKQKAEGETEIKKEEVKEQKSNACGCAGVDGSVKECPVRFLNVADTTTDKSAKKDESNDKIVTTAIVIGASLLTVTLLTVLVTSLASRKAS